MHYQIRSNRTEIARGFPGESRRVDQKFLAQDDRIGFQEWFDVAIPDLAAELQRLNPKVQAMRVPSPPCRTFTKKVSASMYLSDQFPISIEDFLPVVNVLASTNDTLEHVETFFQKVCDKDDYRITSSYSLLHIVDYI